LFPSHPNPSGERRKSCPKTQKNEKKGGSTSAICSLAGEKGEKGNVEDWRERVKKEEKGNFPTAAHCFKGKEKKRGGGVDEKKRKKRPPSPTAGKRGKRKGKKRRGRRSALLAKRGRKGKKKKKRNVGGLRGPETQPLGKKGRGGGKKIPASCQEGGKGSRTEPRKEKKNQDVRVEKGSRTAGWSQKDGKEKSPPFLKKNAAFTPPFLPDLSVSQTGCILAKAEGGKKRNQVPRGRKISTTRGRICHEGGTIPF